MPDPVKRVEKLGADNINPDVLDDMYKSFNELVSCYADYWDVSILADCVKLRYKTYVDWSMRVKRCILCRSLRLRLEVYLNLAPYDYAGYLYPL